MKKRHWIAILCVVFALALTGAAASADTGDEYKLLTGASELHDGDRIILVSDNGEYYQAMATDFSGVQVIVTSNTITEQDGMLVLTVSETDGGWLLAADGGYLAVNGSSLALVADQADAATWFISIASDGTATLSCADGNLIFDEQDGAYRFACGSGGNEVAIYNAPYEPEQHAFGDGLWWAFSNGKLTIGGNGAMPEFAFSSDQPWASIRSKITEVEIPDSVTSIGKYAFSECTGLTSITIPDGVTSIGQYAFSECTGLTSITTPDSVTSIGRYAFSSCAGLQSITMPCSASIGKMAFSDCTAITSVHLTKGTGTMADYTSSTYQYTPSTYQYTPWYISRNNAVTIVLDDGIQNIGNYAFYYCTGLTSITIPDSVTSIGEDAFSDCTGLTSITIGNGVTCIGSSAFSGCTGLTEITIPDSVQYLSGFSGCTGLTSITIPDSVTSIGDFAFSSCTGLTSITIPNSVTSIGQYAFLGCRGLTSITIPDSVTSIGNYAFSGCTGLASITIGNGVTSIGEDAFNGCTGLTSITIGNGVTSIGENAFLGTGWWNAQNDGLVYLDYILLGVKGTCGQIIRIKNGTRLIAGHAFEFETQITKVTIPDSVTSIGNYAFSGCTGLASITIGNGVTSIGEDAFNGCTGLQTITMPCSAKCVYSAFSGCTAITSVHLTKGTGTMADYSGIAYTPWYISRNNAVTIVLDDGIQNIGDYVFFGCTGLTSITIPDSVTSIGDFAFSSCTGLTSITTPDSVTGIGAGAFSGCAGLQSITMPCSASIGKMAFSDCTAITSVHLTKGTGTMADYTSNTYRSTPWYISRNNAVTIVLDDGIQNIGNYAFYDCTGLTSITISDSVTSIGDYAFYHSTGLTAITIPDSVTSIGDYAFFYCSGLTSITIPDGVTSIGDYAFDNCTGLTAITIPDGVTSIERGAFYNCSGLTSITIPDSVTSIGQYVFYNCTGLTSITIPDSVTSIEGGAFSGCNALKDVYYLGTARQKENLLIWDNNGRLQNATWHYLHAQTVSKSLTLEGDIKINFYVVVSDDALADEGSYARLTLNGKTTEMLAKDAPVSVKDGVTRRQFTQSIVAKEMQDAVALELFDGSGRRLALFDSDGTEVRGALLYAANDYVEAAQESGLGALLKALVQACANYGVAAQIQFGYKADGLTLPAAVTSVTKAQVAPFEAAYTGELPAGIDRNTSTLLIESDNTIRQYFYLANGHTINEFAFTVDGFDADPIRVSDSKYYLEVANIPAKLLDEPHTFAVVDKADHTVVLYSVAYSALSYAYKALSYDDTISPVNLKNMARAIFLYNQAANAYFDNN